MTYGSLRKGGLSIGESDYLPAAISASGHGLISLIVSACPAFLGQDVDLQPWSLSVLPLRPLPANAATIPTPGLFASCSNL